MSPAVIELLLKLLALASTAMEAGDTKDEFDRIHTAVQDMVKEGRNPRREEFNDLMGITEDLTDRLNSAANFDPATGGEADEGDDEGDTPVVVTFEDLANLSLKELKAAAKEAELPKKIKSYKKIADLAQDYFLYLLDKQPDTVSLTEAGLKLLSVEEIDTVAAHYKVDVSSFQDKSDTAAYASFVWAGVEGTAAPE